ncbi:MAG TPA: APC family permease [Coriobacteriia bacterium]|nr:APC family permease [Coriobacteriia bacterium]
MSSAKTMTRTQAVFIGIGAMVGAGIFALLGEAGAIALSAVWLSFLLAGIVAGLQGYSFAQLGKKYASAAGLVGYLAAGYGKRSWMMSISAWLAWTSTTIVLAMVAVSFGTYAAATITGGDMPPTLTKVMATAIVVAVTLLIGLGGAEAVAKTQSWVIRLVIVVLLGLAAVTMLTADWSLLAPSTYPPVRAVIGSIALTFFAFLGFGVVSFTAKDLKDVRDLGPATYIALALTTLIYVAISLGVFGQLTPEQVTEAGPTAIALAARPVLGDLGYWVVAVTAMLSTAGAVNSTMYPAPNLLSYLAEEGIFPPLFDRKIGSFHSGLLLSSVVTLGFIWFFNLTAIASLGSAVALLIFLSISVGHFRIRTQTAANPAILVVAILSVVVTLIGFLTTTLAESPSSLLAFVGLLILTVILDGAWRMWRTGHVSRPSPTR